MNSMFGSAIKNGTTAFLKKSYMDYYMKKFEKMLKIADVVITPCKEDSIAISEKFKGYKKKIRVIPLVFLGGNGQKQKSKTVPIHKIRKVLFIGTSDAFYGYPVKNRVNVMIENDPAKLYLCIEELNRHPKLIKKIQENMGEVVEHMSPERIESAFVNMIEKR